MIEHPWVLVFFSLFLVYWYYRKSVKFYLRHAYLEILSGQSLRSYLTWNRFILAGAFCILLGACNFIWQTKEVTKSYLAHKYVLVNDGSGSMVNTSKENGIGNELTAVLSGNDKLFDFLGKRNDGSKDLVGAIVFSNDAFVVSGLSDDPYFVQKKLKRIDYRLSPMNSGTDIESGLWAGLEMIILNDVPQEELNYLQLRFYNVGDEVKLDERLNKIIQIKNKFIGSSIIIFTDGIFNAVGSSNKMSSYKIINFCKMLGIRVYFISIFDLDKNLIRFCKATGGRGDIIKGYDKKRLEQIYEEIVTSQANEYIIKEEVVDRSFGSYFGLAGLVLVFIGLILHTTTQLNFTEL